MIKTKIVSISMVKNEMDIIESFVRYNVNILDCMLILDNGSTDDTIQILKSLQKEGLPIYIFEDENKEYDQISHTNKLLKKAVYEFKASIVIPLDADEFIISSKKGNPRSLIEKIDNNTFFYSKWKTYVPTFMNNDKFLPLNITFSRDDELDEFYKVIIPAELVKNYDVRVSMGNHDLVYDNKYENNIEGIFNENLRIAHFPIRSKEQVVSKVLVGWLNALCSLERPEGACFQWKELYDQIKENKEIQNKDVTSFAKEYALTNKKRIINLNNDPMDLSFCKNIELKYTNSNINPLANFLENCEWLSRSYLNLKKEKVIEEQNLINSIQEYERSKSWIMTSPLRKISRKTKSLLNNCNLAYRGK